MRVLLLANRRSGVGKAWVLAEGLSERLRHEGHEVRLIDPAEALAAETLATNGDELAAAGSAVGDSVNGRVGPTDAVVSVGGDGTIYHALPQLLRSDTPVYHVPGGNENLFAREFGMDREPERLVRALAEPRPELVDVGLVDGVPFAIMVSVGPDAGVIHRLHAVRSRATGHAMYLRPTLAEGVRPHLPRLTVQIDGRELVRERRGFLIVANSRQYALRLDPAHTAEMRDGLLDAVFFPAASTAAVVGWLARCFVGARKGLRGPIAARGAEIEVTTSERAPWQVDGEAGGWLEPGTPLRFTVRSRVLRVLRP